MTRRSRFAGLAAIVVALAGCGTPDSVTVSRMPDSVEATDGATGSSDSAASAVESDDASGSTTTDDDAPTTDEGDAEASETTEIPAVLGPEGAFDAENGRPLRVLVRPVDSDEWHWIDSQTGAYVAPGEAPEM